MTFTLFIQWIGQEVKSGYFYFCCFSTGHSQKWSLCDWRVSCYNLVIGRLINAICFQDWELLVWECNTGTKKCSPAPGLSGQWCKDHLWKSLQGTEFQRWNLAFRNREKAPRVETSNKKNLKCELWETETQESVMKYNQKCMVERSQKRGGEASPTCLCKSWKKCHILFVVFLGWLKNSLKSSNISQEKILGFFFLGVLEGGGVLFHVTFLVFKLEDFQHPGVKLKSLPLGSLGAYQKSMAWRMENVSKMWDWQEILAHFCLIFTFLACRGSFSASGKSFSAKPLSDKSAQKYTLNWHVAFEIKV